MLYPLSDGKRWGFMDEAGAVVVPPCHLESRPLGDGRAAFRTPEGWGFVDENGQVAVPPAYHEAHDFHEGLAAVRPSRTGEPRWGFVDRDGHLVLDAAFTDVTDLHEGLAWVARTDGWRGFVANSGAMVFPWPFKTTFHEGLAPVSDAAAEHPGYVANHGAWSVVLPRGCEPFPFRDGVALVARTAPGAGTAPPRRLVTFVDRAGATLLETNLVHRDGVTGFAEGLAAVHDDTPRTGAPKGAWGYLDRSGRLAIPARYAVARAFCGGLAVAGTSPTQRGLIDHAGKAVVPPQYQEIHDVENGLARVVPNAKQPAVFGYVDVKGKVVWRPGAPVPAKRAGR